jgi:hypothetical protein
MFDWSLAGAGAGLLPTLWKMYSNSSSNNNAGATTPAVSPITAGSDAAVGSDGIRNPISGPEQPGARLDSLGNPLTTGTTQPIQSGYTNPLTNPDKLFGAAGGSGSDTTSNFSTALSGLGKSLGSGGPTNTPGGSAYTPPAAPVPQGGGGTSSSINGLEMNPLMVAYLKARLGNSGGGLG